jgi:hypothetical protein
MKRLYAGKLVDYIYYSSKTLGWLYYSNYYADITDDKNNFSLESTIKSTNTSLIDNINYFVKITGNLLA